MPRTGLLLTSCALGLAVGIGVYTFAFARGASYLTNDPAACANCHVMNDQFAGWARSSHRSVAACNDCHTPPGLVAKYTTKAVNGYFHSLAFTTGRFHEPIAITARNLRATEKACRHCHAAIVEQIDHPFADQGPGLLRAETISCVRCHAEVGHP
jgi:cytochrome c nitrite reductase small subunit